MEEVSRRITRQVLLCCIATILAVAPATANAQKSLAIEVPGDGASALAAVIASQSAATISDTAVELVSDDMAGETPDAGVDAVPAQAPPPAAPQAPAVKSRVIFSQFADLPVSGSAAETVRYGGKVDAYFDVSGSTFGLDDSWTLHVHPEFKYGESANNEIGLLPSNTQLSFPGEGEVFDLTVNIKKTWKSGTSLAVGKFNILDLAAQLPVIGGGGHEGFQNLAMALPPSAIIPGSITGAMLNVPTKKALYRLWVFDPDLQSERTGFETAFESGVAFLGSVTVPLKVGGKQGYYALKLAGSTRDEIAKDSLPAALIPSPGSGFGEGEGEFSAVLAGYQFIDHYADHPGKGWGIFGQVYVSKGDPTFLDKSAIFGFSGNPRFRPQDRFGASWFRYSLTDRLVEVLANRVALEDEEGVEYFYTLGLSDNLNVTANLQVIDSAVTVRDSAVLAGMRLTAKF